MTTVHIAFCVHIQAEAVELIEENGIDERFGQLNGLFGAGNYFAENASKVKSRVLITLRDKELISIRIC